MGVPMGGSVHQVSTVPYLYTEQSSLTPCSPKQLLRKYVILTNGIVRRHQGVGVSMPILGPSSLSVAMGYVGKGSGNLSKQQPILYFCHSDSKFCGRAIKT